MTTTTRSAAKNQAKAAGASPADEAQAAQPGSKHKAGERAGSPRPNLKRTKRADEKEQQQHNGAPTEEAAQQSKAEVASKDSSSAVEPQGRDEPESSLPSSLLEKGIIYFFFRPRVNVSEPSSVGDIARSHMILRPLEKDAKLGRGPIGDAGNSRVCVIPKKALPRSGRDRWTAFVEKAGAPFARLRDEFLASADYRTKTAGERHAPAAAPAGEGVYAITSTGRESHLAYMLTLPEEELGDVQREMGLRRKGSFVIATKNPQYPGPAGARLLKPPEYPKELLEEFRSLRWVPTQPKHLDYANTQFLLVGETSGVRKALEPQEEDRKEGKVGPAEEMEKLEDEDARRMKDLSEDDSGRIFADLQAQAADYPQLQTTF